MSTPHIRIKFSRFCFVCLWLFLNGSAQAENIAVETKTVENLFVRVFSSKFTTNDTPVDDRLSFCVWQTTTNGDVTVYMPTALEYVYRIELLDTNGSALPKKQLAEKIGVKFWNLKPSFGNDTGYKLKIQHTTPSLGGEYLFFPYKPGYDNPEPPCSPNDLFEIEQPGKYTMRIQFQFIVRTASGQNVSAHVIRFPPLLYPLVKLATPTNSLSNSNEGK